MPRHVAASATPTVETTTEEFRDVTDGQLEELKRLLKTAGRPLTNQEVADQLSVSKGESSKRVTRLVKAGFAKRHRLGRRVAIVLH